MPDVLSLRVLSDSGADLCRTRTQACVACCRGPAMPERALTRALRRQTDQFRRRLGAPKHLPSVLALIAFEVVVRRGSPLVFAPLFLLPGLGPLLRVRFGRRMCCSFLGFPDGDELRPGCLLHPSRWGGRDTRGQVAFALLPGMRCGEPGYSCRTVVVYRNTGVNTRRTFRERTRGLAWFEYSRVVESTDAVTLAVGPPPTSATLSG